jgi:hypothetical protein
MGEKKDMAAAYITIGKMKMRVLESLDVIETTNIMYIKLASYAMCLCHE